MSVFVRYELMGNGRIDRQVRSRRIVLDREFNPRPVFRVIRGRYLSDLRTIQACHTSDYVLEFQDDGAGFFGIRNYRLSIVSGPSNTASETRQLCLVPVEPDVLRLAMLALHTRHPQLANFMGFKFNALIDEELGLEPGDLLTGQFDSKHSDGMLVETSSVLPAFGNRWDGKTGTGESKQMHTIASILGTIPEQELELLMNLARESPRHAIDRPNNQMEIQVTDNNPMPIWAETTEEVNISARPTWYIISWSGNVSVHSGETQVDLPGTTSAAVKVYKNAFIDYKGEPYGLYLDVFIQSGTHTRKHDHA